MLFVVSVALFPNVEAAAQDDKRLSSPDVVVEIGGLACPFCAYGIEKRVRKLEEVAELAVLLEEGKIQIILRDGRTISSDRLAKAIEDAGFEAQRIEFLNPASEDAG